MTDINITYETLYEILRNEKNREDLQELSPTFYQDVITYLSKNKAMLDKAIKEDYSDEDKEDLIRQVKNIRNLIREIYERREKKIINLSLNKSRTQSDLVEINTLLPMEKALYDGATDFLDKSRRDILQNMLNGTEPIQANIDDNHALKMTAERKERSTIHSSPPMNSPESKEAIETSQQSKHLPSDVNVNTDEKEIGQTENHKSNLSIKFKENVPKFLGKELEVYGPYEPEDTATIPFELAQILINKGKAEQI
ncbi:DNA replication complex GINS family protein [Candidatus Woesearchaeota archaeon]|nr:DNA replication complex GINS family protein [Candidatus Woesearchaeota archaeon]